MKQNEEEDDLALFVEVRKDDFSLLHNSDEFEVLPGSKPGSSPIFKIVSSPPPPRKTLGENFLNMDGDKNDYDWLLTPPGTPFISSPEIKSPKTIMSEKQTPETCLSELKSRFADCQVEPASRENSSCKQISSPSLNSSSAGSSGPSSSDSHVSTIYKPKCSTEHNTVSLSTKSSRVVMPISKATLTSSKPIVPSTWSITSSKKAFTPKVPACKSTSRSGTPTRLPSNSSTVSSVSMPPGRSTSVGKWGPKTTKNAVPSRGSSSSTVRSRPENPSEMPGLSTDAPKSFVTSMTKRPVSTSKCRRGTPNSNGRQKQCSPSRGRGPNGSDYSNGSSLPAARRSYPHEGDDVNPVLIGTKMVERVVNMRKLAPPKQDNQPTNNLAGKSSSQGSSGFGRTLSKSSLDMALRHMDIGRSIPSNLQKVKTKAPASSMYSVKSGISRSKSNSVSDSPLAASSNASSELSLNSIPRGFEINKPNDNVTNETIN